MLSPYCAVFGSCVRWVHTMDGFVSARLNMVNSQICAGGVLDRRILDAFLAIPREIFVSPSLRSVSYVDGAIPSVAGDSLMAPASLAQLIQLSAPLVGDSVLVIGDSAGYSSSILRRLCRSVVLLVEDSGSAGLARENLSSVAVENVSVVEGALPEGWPSGGPYDLIFITGAVGAVPKELLSQCKEGGRVVTVLRRGVVGRATLFQRRGERMVRWHAFDSMVDVLPAFCEPVSFDHRVFSCAPGEGSL